MSNIFKSFAVMAIFSNMLFIANAFRAFGQNMLFSYFLCTYKMVPVRQVFLNSYVSNSYFLNFIVTVMKNVQNKLISLMKFLTHRVYVELSPTFCQKQFSRHF